ncbi:glycoside hydrolase family 3 protein [Duganella sp. FT135W]|uniref:beta-glucosidase n=1 Tax=Duganella flavida TaxID=2692175 RepID=A0A6L8K327_9BURK|nr:glycoside hydrolase family 3 N-terminal domain-containing protein [Duganella flavida]MYM21846.1 glycoside hydrolase family 3 protein [Duganella flavida]
MNPDRLSLRALLPVCLALQACAVTAVPLQPDIGVRSKAVLKVDGLAFRDANGNGQLDPYEDWRLPVPQRVADLLGRMSMQEKAGMMLIDTLNAGCGGTLPPQAQALLGSEHMTRFILRNLVVGAPAACGADGGGMNGAPVTPGQMASFTNAVQALAESQGLGIPVLFKSNPRNHVETDPRFGIGSGAGVLSEFPKEPGMAAAALGSGSMEPVRALARVTGQEWRALGIRGMYGYQADLATEPRWHRVHETFGENADLSADIITALVEGLQGGVLNPASAVALTIKHFPGGGPQEDGLDPHYSFGKSQVYPAGQFEYALKPFNAAIKAGVSSIMPYYGVPRRLRYDGVDYQEIGFAFNAQVVNRLLRDQLGFKGNVNSDTGIVSDRAWGLEQLTVPERIAAAVNGGTDVLSGFHQGATVSALVDAGLVTAQRIDLAVSRLLSEQFQLGLFENPYVDAQQADAVVGSAANRAAGLKVQQQSVVLLQNGVGGSGALLPFKPGATLYTVGVSKAEAQRHGYHVTDGTAAQGQARPSAAGHDYALIRVLVSNVNTSGYRTRGADSGADPAKLNPRTGKVWGAEDGCELVPARNPRCADDAEFVPGHAMGLIFGGALPWEVNSLSFSTMAQAQSWRISPSLAEIQAVMGEVGAGKTVLDIYFRNPYVLDDASGLKNAGALVATFGVSDRALLDVLSGQARPLGRLPFALANRLQAVIDNDPDAPGYPASDTLYPFGFGLDYR